MIAAPDTLPVAGPEGGSGQRHRAAIEFSIGGSLRFLSHRDELQLLTRALIRAQWPLSYSRGFNPKPHMTVPLPRNVGTTAICQVAVVDLSTPSCPDELHRALAAQLPVDCRLRRVIAPAPRATPHAVLVCYEVELAASDEAEMPAQIERIMALSSLVVEREQGPKRPTRPFDIRPHVEKLELDGNVLRIVLRLIEQRVARPSEVLTALGLAAEAYNHLLRRVAVQWDIELTGPTNGPAACERYGIGYEEDHHKEED